MAIRQLAGHVVEKLWGRRDVPLQLADARHTTEPVGEVWFADAAAPDLMVKWLFTSEKLSIQVHPDDALARASGHTRGKEEAWYVISAEPGAVIGAGFAEALTTDELRAASLDGRVEQLMTWHPAGPGDFFHVPAGTVHAIGAGLSLIEIQQNVDLTYRLFDYGRPRPLQLDDGLVAAVAAPFVPAAPLPAGPARTQLVASPRFAIERLVGVADHQVTASAAQPAWLIPVAGDCRAGDTPLPAFTVWLADADATINLGPGGCLLVARAGPPAP